MAPKTKESTPTALVIWDRVCADAWSCTEEHARAVRLRYTGARRVSWNDEQCAKGCRCPRGLMRMVGDFSAR